MEKTNKELTWKAHPAKERVRETVLASIVISVLVAMVYLSFRSFSWSIMAAALLLLSLNRFFFPSRFTIDREGITASYPLRRLRYSWVSVRRFLHDENGGYLSSRKGSSRLDAYRGMHILFGEHPERVIRQIKRHMQEVKSR